MKGDFVMKVAELKRKARENEGMTVSEIKAYEKLVKPKVHAYGKYGTLAKKYLEEHPEIKQQLIDKIKNNSSNESKETKESEKTKEKVSEKSKNNILDGLSDEDILIDE